MKNIILSIFWIASLQAFAQDASLPLQNLRVVKDQSYVQNADETVSQKFSLSSSVNVTGSSVNYITCAVIKTTDGVDTQVMQMDINPKNVDSQQAYSPSASSYFVQNGTVYFFITPLDSIDGCRLQLTAYDGHGALLQSLCYGISRN